MKLVCFMLWSSQLLFAGNNLQEVANGFDKSKPVQISVISEDDANKLFQKFAHDKSLPHKYVENGCQARAHSMAYTAEKSSNILMGKVFAEGSLQLVFKDGTGARWPKHVALIVYVRGTNGKTEIKVFDPATFDRPATLKEWEERIANRADGYDAVVRDLYFGARFQYFPRAYEGNKNAWDQKDLYEMNELNKRNVRKLTEPKPEPVVTERVFTR